MGNSQSFPYATRVKIYKLGQQKPRLSNRAIAAKVKCDHTMVMKYRNAKPQLPGVATVSAPELHSAIRKLLKKAPSSAAFIAEVMDIKPARVAAAIREMRQRGALIIDTKDGRYDLSSPIHSAAGHLVIKGGRGEWNYDLGLISDTHQCNKHSRQDVMDAAYDHYERMGITTVLHGGNWVDGEARFNKAELVTAPGMDNQLDYMIDNYPQRKGITTYLIAGDDHEGWYAQREGVEIGKYLQFRAEDQGRHDLKYLGYAEADIELQAKSGASAVARLVHPGGGSAYAISYTDQKRVESYQGGEKPSIEWAGHYHKFNYGYPREVHTHQLGCCCDQTLFMRKKRLQAHVGFGVTKIKQDSTDGHITAYAPQFFPFYDRGYYEKRF